MSWLDLMKAVFRGHGAGARNAAECFDDDADDEAPQYMLARLKPKAPMLAWVRGLPKSELELQIEQDFPNPATSSRSSSLETMHSDAIGFLIPPFDSIGEARAYVEARWRKVWESELFCWYEDKRHWPKLTKAEFHRWFDIEIIDMVMPLN